MRKYPTRQDVNSETPTALTDSELRQVFAGRNALINPVAIPNPRRSPTDIPDCIIWNIDGANVSSPR